MALRRIWVFEEGRQRWVIVGRRAVVEVLPCRLEGQVYMGEVQEGEGVDTRRGRVLGQREWQTRRDEAVELGVDGSVEKRRSESAYVFFFFCFSFLGCSFVLDATFWWY